MKCPDRIIILMDEFAFLLWVSASCQPKKKKEKIRHVSFQKKFLNTLFSSSSITRLRIFLPEFTSFMFSRFLQPFFGRFNNRTDNNKRTIGMRTHR